jgi:hypothetical protein
MHAPQRIARKRISVIGGFCQLNTDTFAGCRHIGESVADEQYFRSDRGSRVDNFAPLRKATTHDLAVVHSGQ